MSPLSAGSGSSSFLFRNNQEMVSLPFISDFESTDSESSTLADAIHNDRVNIFLQNTSDENENVDDLSESDERAEINEVLFW